MKVLLWINKHRANKRGEAPLMLRVTHQGQRVNVSTDLKVNPDQWDNKRQRVKGSSDLVKEMNNLLNTQVATCLNTVAKFISEGKPFSTHDIAEVIKGQNKEEKGWLELFDTHLKHIEARIGVDYSKGTLTRYKSSRKNLKLFIESLNKKDVHLSRVDRRMVSAFDQFLRGELGFSNNYVIKTFQQVRKVFREGVLQGYVTHDPFDMISFKKTETTKDYLYHDELEKLVEWQTDIQWLDLAKDVFLFMCYTGLAYTDTKKASINDISIDAHGRPWLILRRTKNNNLVQVPLLKQVVTIISKYETCKKRVKEASLLPVPCNQVLNRQLKELAKAVGINKHICTHSGRYTFASTVLLGNGVRVEVAQKLLAHNSIKSTMIYGKLSNQAILKDVEDLEGRLE